MNIIPLNGRTFIHYYMQNTTWKIQSVYKRKMLKRNVVKTMWAPRPRISEREATAHHLLTTS